jgi:predicted unusual protein kinase regulating ubiquinone biosynthesis (AarF/ABC1/UbiB family)
MLAIVADAQELREQLIISMEQELLRQDACQMIRRGFMRDRIPLLAAGIAQVHTAELGQQDERLSRVS